MMRTLIVSLVLVAFVAITVDEAFGQKVRTRNSNTWANRFEGGGTLDGSGDPTPMPNSYAYNPSGTADFSTDGDILSMGFTWPSGVINAGQAGWAWAPEGTAYNAVGRGWNNDQSTTYSAELRVKLDPGTAIANSLRGLGGDGLSDLTFAIIADAQKVQIGAPGGGPSTTVSFDMGADYHTYRITKEPDPNVTGGALFNVYIDTDDVAFSFTPTTGLMHTGNEATLKTGAPWTNPTGFAHVDHYRFQSGKALALPEPASLALLGLGAMTVVLRRRRTES
jgi:hypothetical protein